MSKSQVVLLHGLLRSRFSMSYLARQLQKEGFDTFNYGYPSRSKTIEEQSKRLHGVLQNRIDRSSPLSFVTHSLGSIVVRRFALDFGAHYSLTRLVMLGPPNQGSRFAASLRNLPVIPRILGPAFDELCNLKLSDDVLNMQVGVIAGGRGSDRGYSPLLSGDNDGIVGVDETLLSSAKAHKITAGIHSFLMYYPSVIREVVHFLKEGDFIQEDNL